MLKSINIKQLYEWMAYAELEPFDHIRGDAQAAMIAATIANVMRGKGVAAKPLNDFMLQFEPKEMTWQQMLAISKTMAAASQEEDEKPKRFKANKHLEGKV